MDRSITDSVSEDTPIFMTRPVDDTGGMITGGAAHVGSVVRTVVRRSWTSCLAATTSVPDLKSSSIDDRSGIDLDRMMSRLSTPLNACSSGTVTRASTSSAVIPRDGVWISTRGGANSGNASTGMLGIWALPYPIIATASASTMYRNFRLDLTIERITAGTLPVGSFFLELFLAAEQLGRAGRDDHRAHRRAGRQHRRLAVDVVHRHGRPHERERVLRGAVRPGVAVLVVQERRIGNHFAQRPTNHDGPQRRGLDVESFGRLRRHGHPAEIRPFDLLDLHRSALDFLLDRRLRAGRQGQTGDAQSDSNPSIVGLHRFLPSFRRIRRGLASDRRACRARARARRSRRDAGTARGQRTG